MNRICTQCGESFEGANCPRCDAEQQLLANHEALIRHQNELPPLGREVVIGFCIEQIIDLYSTDEGR